LFDSHVINLSNCAAIVTKLLELRYKIVPYPLCSPDLTPSSYFFLNMKKWLKNKILIK